VPRGRRTIRSCGRKRFDGVEWLAVLSSRSPTVATNASVGRDSEHPLRGCGGRLRVFWNRRGAERDIDAERCVVSVGCRSRP